MTVSITLMFYSLSCHGGLYPLWISWMRNALIVSGIWTLSPQFVEFFGRFRRCSLLGGSMTLEVGFESLKTAFWVHSLPCVQFCCHAFSLSSRTWTHWNCSPNKLFCKMSWSCGSYHSNKKKITNIHLKPWSKINPSLHTYPLSGVWSHKKKRKKKKKKQQLK